VDEEERAFDAWVKQVNAIPDRIGRVDAFRAGWQARAKELADLREQLELARTYRDTFKQACYEATERADRALAEVGRFTKALETIARRGCADPGYGGCIGERCASCVARAALQPRGEEDS
jgi:hypothetical protein